MTKKISGWIVTAECHATGYYWAGLGLVCNPFLSGSALAALCSAIPLTCSIDWMIELLLCSSGLVSIYVASDKMDLGMLLEMNISLNLFNIIYEFIVHV